jgi:drug/metabolite transporter (DMT)-like permease
LGLLIPVFLIFGGSPNATSLIWGAASGIATGVGLVFLFRALAQAMAVGAAIAGISTALLPVIVGLLSGERPTAIALVGLVLAVIAIGTIVYERPHDGEGVVPERVHRFSLVALRQRGIIDGFIAGCGWGGTSIFLAQTPVSGGLWPLASAQTATVVILSAISIGTGTGLATSRDVVRPSVAVGVLHLAGVMAFLLALQRGLLTLVAVVQSLYPAVTILLARLFLREPLAPTQIAGLVLAGVGITLIGLG